MHLESTPREFTGRHMLIIMLSFFGVILAANMAMLWFAAQSWTGLVVKNSYVASQGFNKHLAKVEKQRALGWSSTLSNNNGLMIFDLKDKSGQTITGLKIAAYAQRPAHEHEDKVLQLSTNGKGQYVHDSPLPKGAWKIRIEASDNRSVKYIQDFQIYVK